MKIYKVNKILQDKNMQNKECNFKLTSSGRITTSDILEIMDKRFDQIDKRFEQIDRKFDQIDKRFEQIDKRFDILIKEMRFGFEQVNSRINNLVKKNNLKE